MDNASSSSADEVVQAAKSSGVLVYSIGIGNPNSPAGMSIATGPFAIGGDEKEHVDAVTLSRLASGPLHQTRRDVVSIPAIALDCMTRRQPLALVVKQLADERTRGGSARPALGPNCIEAQKLLSLVPYRTVDDRLMLAGIARAFVSDLANVNGIAEQGVERAARERLPPVRDPLPAMRSLEQRPSRSRSS